MSVQERQDSSVAVTPADGLSTATVALLIAAPLIMAGGRALLVPFDDQGWDSVLNQMAAHQGRSDAGWLLALAACGLLATTAAVLAGRLRRGGRGRSAAFVVVSTALGWAGTAAICGGGLMMSVAAKAPDRTVQVQILKDFNNGISGLIYLLCAIAAVGYVVLAVGLARGHVVSAGAAVLIGLGGATTLLTMPGPMKVLLVATALLLAAGHALAIRSLSGGR
jgi:hypothetical protein